MRPGVAGGVRMRFSACGVRLPERRLSRHVGGGGAIALER